VHVGFRLTSAQMENGISVVSVRGDVDPARTAEVDHELDALHGRGVRHLILDLLDVPFIETGVLSVLLKHSRRLRIDGGTLALVIDNEAIARGVERILGGHCRIAPTLSEALDAATAAAS